MDAPAVSGTITVPWTLSWRMLMQGLPVSRQLQGTKAARIIERLVILHQKSPRWHM